MSADGLLKVALDCAARGWFAFPCRADKTPMTKHGFLDATLDADQITEWWTKRPTALVGVATGASGLVVADVDTHGEVNGYDAWQDLTGLAPELEDTALVKTPSGGQHAYYQANGHKVANSTGRVGPGIDVRAEGGYVIAAGNPGYEYVDGHGPERVADLPAVLAAKVAYRHTQSPVIPEAVLAIPEGSRNGTLTSQAGAMRRVGMEEKEIELALLVTNKRCKPPLPEAEVRTIAHSVARYKPSLVHDCSDDGNAQRLISKHGDKVRYLPGEEKWLIWDERRWKRDDAHQIEHLTAEALRTIHHEAAEATTETLINQLSRWAITSGQSQRRSGALMCARSEPAVVVRREDLDRDPYLLNVENGTLDLHTGKLQPHRQADALTWLAPVEFHGLDVHDAIFDKVLHDATGGDPEFQCWLQRYAGMSLVGDMTELVLILLGGTETGKSTLTGALTATLGEGNYALTGNQEALLKSSNTGGPRGSVMAFEGRRLVTIPEFDPTKTLDEPLLKTLTGERIFQGRELYKNDHAMQPISKLWLHTNHMPKVTIDDSSLWRRLRVAPFDCRPAHIDETIKPYLNDPGQAGPAILAWALQGCLDWQAAGGGKDGLGCCAIVDGATAALRVKMDPLADFFEECCVFELDAFTSTADIRTRYVLWADTNNVPKNQRRGDKLRASGLRLRGASDKGPGGYQKVNGRQVRGWTNVRLDGLGPLFRSES